MVMSGVAAQHVQPGPRNTWTQEERKFSDLNQAAAVRARVRFGLGPVAQLVRAHP